jgi:HK97 family phage portal protein
MRPSPVLRQRRPDLVDRAALRPPEPIKSAYGQSSDALAALLGISELPTYATSVTENNVSGLAAVQSGVDMIAHAVATMMVEAECFTDAGEQVDPPQVVRRPTTLLGAFEWYTGLVDVVMKRGNGLGLQVDFDTAGDARQIVPVHPDACSLDDSMGIPVYTIGDRSYLWDEVLHVRHGAPWGSLWGRGIIARYRLALQRHLAEAEWGRSSFMNAGVPSVVVSLEKDVVDDTEAQRVKDRYKEMTGGATREPLVVGRLMKIEPISWDPEDAEWAENRRVSVGEAALMCGLHPADLGASLGGSLDYANITERQLARVLQSFSPWMRLVEEAMSDVLPDGINVRGKVEALLRSAPKERLEMLEIGQRIGAYTAEEIRVELRRPPAPAPDPERQGQLDDDEHEEETP